jgi:ABC-type Zn uptake system ZnuABC Zn-binding protein ZnuA
MLVLDPLGGEDYFATMRANLAALKEGLAGK